MAGTDCGRKVATTTNVTRVSVEGALGDADWVAAQTEHFADSIALECSCAAAAIADQNVSKTNRHAIRFEIDLITANPMNLMF